MSIPSTADVLRWFDEQIKRLQEARSLVFSQSAEKAPNSAPSTSYAEKHSSRASHNGAPKLTIPQVLERVMQPDYLTINGIIGDADRRIKAGEFTCDSELNTTAVRTGLARIHKKRGYEKGLLHGQVAYRRGTARDAGASTLPGGRA